MGCSWSRSRREEPQEEVVDCVTTVTPVEVRTAKPPAPKAQIRFDGPDGGAGGPKMKERSESFSIQRKDKKSLTYIPETGDKNQQMVLLDVVLVGKWARQVTEAICVHHQSACDFEAAAAVEEAQARALEIAGAVEEAQRSCSFGPSAELMSPQVSVESMNRRSSAPAGMEPTSPPSPGSPRRSGRSSVNRRASRSSTGGAAADRQKCYIKVGKQMCRIHYWPIACFNDNVPEILSSSSTASYVLVPHKEEDGTCDEITDVQSRLMEVRFRAKHNKVDPPKVAMVVLVPGSCEDEAGAALNLGTNLTENNSKSGIESLQVVKDDVFDMQPLLDGPAVHSGDISEVHKAIGVQVAKWMLSSLAASGARDDGDSEEESEDEDDNIW